MEERKDEEERNFGNFRSAEKNFGRQISVGQIWSAAVKRQVEQIRSVAEKNSISRSPTSSFEPIGDRSVPDRKPAPVSSKETSVRGAASLQTVGMGGRPYQIWPIDPPARPLSHVDGAGKERRLRGEELVGEGGGNRQGVKISNHRTSVTIYA